MPLKGASLEQAPDKPLQTSLMSAGKAMSLPKHGAPALHENIILCSDSLQGQTI
jgi:hypothetical protein